MSAACPLCNIFPVDANSTTLESIDLIADLAGYLTSG